jgi:hypothetical protein
MGGRRQTEWNRGCCLTLPACVAMNASDGDRTGVSIDLPDLVDAPLPDLGRSNVSGMLLAPVCKLRPLALWFSTWPNGLCGQPLPHTTASQGSRSGRHDQRMHLMNNLRGKKTSEATVPRPLALTTATAGRRLAGYKCSEVAFSIPRPNSTLPLNHSENARTPTRYQYRVRRGGHTRQLRCTRRCNILHSCPPACPHPLTPTTLADGRLCERTDPRRLMNQPYCTIN